MPFAMVCRYCGKDMAEPENTHDRKVSQVGLGNSDAELTGSHAFEKNAELARIAQAVERNASATEGIFILMLIMTIVTLLGLGVALYFVYQGIP